MAERNLADILGDENGNIRPEVADELMQEDARPRREIPPRRRPVPEPLRLPDRWPTEEELIRFFNDHWLVIISILIAILFWAAVFSAHSSVSVPNLQNSGWIIEQRRGTKCSLLP